MNLFDFADRHPGIAIFGLIIVIVAVSELGTVLRQRYVSMAQIALTRAERKPRDDGGSS